MTTLFRSKNIAWLLSFIFFACFFLSIEVFSQELTDNNVRPIPPEPELHQQLDLQTESAPGYCSSSGGSTYYESISSADIIQQSGGNLLITIDIFIANPTGCIAGSPCPEYDSSPEYINGWIDWNGNQIFEAHEKILDEALTGYLAINYQGTMTKAVSVAIPPNAVETTWMRVNLGWAHDPNNPCEQYWTWGNVYDRQVQIKKTRIKKLDALKDVEIRYSNGNLITDPVWEEDTNGNIIDNDPIAARYTGAAFDVKAYLGPVDTTWQPRASCNWEIVGTPFSGTNVTFFGWNGLISIILPQKVGVYDLNMVFTIYDEDDNIVNGGQTITRKLYLIYDMPKTTISPKITWLDRGLSWANNASGDSNIVFNIAEGIYNHSNWEYTDNSKSSVEALIEGQGNRGNCVSFSSVWDNLSRSLGIPTIAGSSTRSKGAGAGFLTTTPATALDNNTGNAHPPLAQTDRWHFAMHQTGKHFLTYYDPTAGNGAMPNTYTTVDAYVQWNIIGLDIEGNLMIDAPGTLNWIGPISENNGWGDWEYVVSGVTNSSIMSVGDEMKILVNFDESDNPMIISSSDSGVDTNGDGVWNHLELTVTLNVTSAGEYTLSGFLLSGPRIISSRSNVNDTIIPTSTTTTLSPGTASVKIRFSGEDIRRAGFDGNYVAELQVYDQNGNRIDRESFSTASYNHNQFGEYPAILIGSPEVTTPDFNGDGLYDYLSVAVQVHAGVAGKYMIQGSLSGNGKPISNVHLSQSLSVGTNQLTLQFNGETIRTSEINGPYIVELSLYDEKIQIDFQTFDTKDYNYNDFREPPVELQYFNDYGTDSNLNGLYESLTFVSGMNVLTSGAYQITAWLESQNGGDITYTTKTIDLLQGPQQIALEFPGEAIFESGIDGPYLVAFVRVINTEGGLVASKHNAHETQPYYHTDFEAPVPPLVATTGNYTNTGVDTNGNGLFDFLNIGVEVLASDSGVIIVSGRLLDKTGKEIVYASSFGSVTAGVPKFIILNFDGRYIFGNLHDGPYELKSLLVYHTGDPTQANWIQDAFTTDTYAYDAFEPCAAITGFVKNAKNDPISNVMLSLGSTDFDFTNSKGVYHLVSLTGGTYKVSLSEIAGYPLDSWEIFIDDNMVGYGNSVDVDVSVGDILQVDFKQSTGQPPVAVCDNQIVNADENCQGDASIDGGSYDPDGDPISLEHLPPGPYALGDTMVTLTATDGHGTSDSCTAMVTVKDKEAPVVQALVPDAGEALQDGVTFQANTSDNCGLEKVSFSIRDPYGTTIGYEGLAGNLNTALNKWEHNFDTTQLSDGYYVLLAEATDNSGNESWSAEVPFSIRNWAVLELLPSADNNKAGRTMPVKFALRIVASVDPVQPFVRNEELEIRICNESGETIYQNSYYGDTSTDYRIGTELYITNFKTFKQPEKYLVQIWRPSNGFLIGDFTFTTTK